MRQGIIRLDPASALIDASFQDEFGDGGSSSISVAARALPIPMGMEFAQSDLGAYEQPNNLVPEAGPNQTVFETDNVALDGTASQDLNGGALSYTWRIEGLVIATGPTPILAPLSTGLHEIQLEIADSLGNVAVDDLFVIVADAGNLPPTADAGPDQTVLHTDTVALDGTGSSDPDGSIVNYSWRENGVEIASGPTPAVGPFAEGSHTITLTVTDDDGATDTDSLVITSTNIPPAADAGPDQTVTDLEAVILDGSGSSDPDGTIASYSWSEGGVEIATGPTPTVGPLSQGVHTFVLTVTDDDGATDSDSLFVTATNVAPQADAGPDQVVADLDLVALDGSGSSDPDGTIVSYSWSEGGVEVATGPTPTVGPFTQGSHTIVLTVTDDDGATATDSLLVTATNVAPSADAGPDQSVFDSDSVALDGSGSSDPDGTIVSYSWSEGGAEIATGPTPTVGPFGQGAHTIVLTVTDDDGSTATDSLLLTVTATPDPAQLTRDLKDAVLFLNLPNRVEKSLVGKLNKALKKLEDTNPSNDSDAVTPLQEFIANVESERGNSLNDVQADALIADAQAIVALL